MKKLLKGLIIALFFFILFIFIFVGGWTTVETKDKKDYQASLERVLYSEEYMPNVDEVVNNDNFTFKFYMNRRLFGGCGITVTEHLSEEEYAKKKEEINNSTEFLISPFSYESSLGGYRIPQAEFEVHDFDFRVLSTSIHRYPSYFGMIATSDEKHEIVYFAFDCQDLDYIEDMADFVEENFPRWEK